MQMQGLTLSQLEEEELEKEQRKYKDFIKQFICSQTKFYSSPTCQGVFWGYNFFLKNLDQSLHIAAFADD